MCVSVLCACVCNPICVIASSYTKEKGKEKKNNLPSLNLFLGTDGIWVLFIFIGVYASLQTFIKSLAAKLTFIFTEQCHSAQNTLTCLLRASGDGEILFLG